MTHAITFAEACTDPSLFGPWFEGDSWASWRVIDRALFGEPLDEAELATFTQLTGRDAAPTEPATEAWFIVGRRGGKDVKAASLVAYFATIGAEAFGYLERLTRGERGVVQLLAVDRDQARVCLGYLKAMFEQPMLARMVLKDTADGLDLTNGLGIEITTNDRRRVRGRTVVAAVFDECAFWHSENSINPDTEVYAAVKPAMATIPGAMLIGISSPHARKGLLFQKWKRHWAKASNVLVVQAPTWVMNPNLPRDGEFLSAAFEEDPASASAEFGAEFRKDIEAFVALEVVEACVSTGIHERPRQSGVTYRAFVDPSGGSNDSMTLALTHREGDMAVLDVIRERQPPFSPEAVVNDFCFGVIRERQPPFSPEAVVNDFCELLKSYGVHEVTGDRYAGEWPREQFRKLGVTYELAEKPRSDLYRDLLPVLNSGRADLLDSKKLVTQLVGLERRVARGGRESIDHAPNGHDDVANAVAGAVDLVLERVPPGAAVVETGFY